MKECFRLPGSMLGQLLGAAVLLHVAGVSLPACSCEPERPACEEYQSADAVFVGQALPGPIHFLAQLLGIRAWLRVEEVFKGDLGDNVALRMRFIFPGGCSYFFQGGDRYLVYAYRYEGRLETSICGRTSPVDEAQGDLAYLRRAKKGLVSGRIFGFVTREHTDYHSEVPSQPVSGALVGFKRQSGDSKLVCRVTSDKGLYEFSDLPPGDYEVFVDPKLNAFPESGWEQRRYAVNLSRGGCARVIWTAQAPPIQ